MHMSYRPDALLSDQLYDAYLSLDDHAAALLRRFALDAINRTFAYILEFIVRHDIAIPFAAQGGTLINVTRASKDLPAEPFGDSGWIKRFSRYANGITPGAPESR